MLRNSLPAKNDTARVSPRKKEVLISWIGFLFNEEHPQQKHDQDKDDARLPPESLFAGKTPENVGREISDEKLV
jgi:hypothetical protein